MKTYPLFTILLLTLTSPLALGEGPPGKHPGVKHSSMAEMSAHLDQMQTHMKEMRKEMAESSQIKEPNERIKRLQTHLQDMAKMMQDMHNMRPMMSPTELTTHLKLIERRVDWLQDLVDLVLKRHMIAEGTFYKTYD